MKDLLNCPNCGAPIQKDYCPYCGAVFLDWASFDVNAPTFVKVKDQRGQYRLLKIAITSITEHLSFDDTHLYADNQIFQTIRSPEYRFDAEFQALPFRHYLNPGKDIMEILIQPDKVKDPELLKDLLRGGE